MLIEHGVLTIQKNKRTPHLQKKKKLQGCEQKTASWNVCHWSVLGELPFLPSLLLKQLPGTEVAARPLSHYSHCRHHTLFSLCCRDCLAHSWEKKVAPHPGLSSSHSVMGDTLTTVPTGSPSRGGDVAVYVFNINQPSLTTPFYSVLESVSVFMALSTVFHSINSPDNSPLFHSVLLALFLHYCSF